MTSWCPTCEEILDHPSHPSICTICGSNLQSPPTPTPRPTPSIQPIRFRSNIENLVTIDNDALLWQTPPPEAMDPQQTGNNSNDNSLLSTSKSFLDKLNRITIDNESSSFLHQALISLVCTTTTDSDDDNGNIKNKKDQKIKEEKFIFQATISDFKPFAPYSFHGELHLVQPITGNDPISIPSATTLQNVNLQHDSKKSNEEQNESLSLSSSSSSSSSFIIAFMERGYNTFYQKVKSVQKYNQNQQKYQIKGIICSNNNSTWPYIMKDSTGQANSNNSSIPIVMIKQSDGQILKSILNKKKLLMTTLNNNKKNDNCDIIESCNHLISITANIDASKKSNDCNSCIICTDLYAVNDVIIQLPICMHYFHEHCIIHWLKNHNTCPFCRVELPLEDETEESERRRRIGNRWNGDLNSNRGGSDESQWESIFG